MKKVLFFLIILSTCLSYVYANNRYSAGYMRIDVGSKMINGISMPVFIDVWYPSTDQERQGSYKPFKPLWAFNGTPALGKFPTIMISHGSNGRTRNHKGTAVTLARAGFLVIALQHTKDHWIRRQVVAAIDFRANELAKALNIVKKHQILGNLVDETRLGALGFSLGTVTVLRASGLIPKLSLVNNHCEKNKAKDPMFCSNGDRTWLQKLVFSFISLFKTQDKYQKALSSETLEESGLIPKDEFEAFNNSINFKAIALIAPMGVFFSKNELQSIKFQLALYRLAKDKELVYPFHGEYLHQSLDAKKHRYKVYEDAHHFAFITQFPKWFIDLVKSEEPDIPIFKNPENFDRPAFLKDINTDILDFFQKNL